MQIVYILTSNKYPERIYIGLTTNINKWLKEHNNGDSLYTKRYTPWNLRTQIGFDNRERAEEFEKYLKSGSGFSFLKKRLIRR